MKPTDISNKRFSMVIALEQLPKRHNGHVQWVCQCDCGKRFICDGGSLRSGHQKSCGCLGVALRGVASITHGMSKTSEYRIWKAMTKRCRRPSNRDYIQRGIKVCERWRESFEAFFKDMGIRPTKDHSIERKNNNGNYEPCNCVWATRSEQGNNKRNNRLIEFHGKIETVAQVSSAIGIPYNSLRRHVIRGRTPEEARQRFEKRAGALAVARLRK